MLSGKQMFRKIDYKMGKKDSSILKKKKTKKDYKFLTYQISLDQGSINERVWAKPS